MCVANIGCLVSPEGVFSDVSRVIAYALQMCFACSSIFGFEEKKFTSSRYAWGVRIKP